jgi:hypothetical protein
MELESLEYSVFEKGFQRPVDLRRIQKLLKIVILIALTMGNPNLSSEFV